MSEEKREEEDKPLKPLEIKHGLTLIPRVKLNLTIYPSTPLMLSNPIDDWKTKYILIDYLRTSLSLTLPEEDLQIKREKNIKKRKRHEPVATGTLRVWDLSSFPTENAFLEWRNRFVKDLNEVQLTLEGIKLKLVATLPASDNFNSMMKDCEEFQSGGELDTIVLRGIPSRWFAEPRVSKPSMLVAHTVFSTFGKIRNVNVADDDEFYKDEDEDIARLVSGLYCKIVVQFDKYKDCHDAMKVLCGRSLQKEGSPLKADYDIGWDKDGFFQNTRDKKEKNSMVSTRAADNSRRKSSRSESSRSESSRSESSRSESSRSESYRSESSRR